MTFGQTRFWVLEDDGDDRGSSFTLPRDIPDMIRLMTDVHVATLRPGRLRGNHYHLDRDEIIIVTASDRWSLHWDAGENSQVSRQQFGAGCVLVMTARGCAHAVVNDGNRDLTLMALTTGAHDPARPDAFRRIVATS